MSLREYIDAYGEKIGVPKSLRDSIFQNETGFEHYDRAGKVKTSVKGARGVGQLMPATARTLGVDADDPIQNAYGSLKLQKQLYDKYLKAQGDPHQAAILAAAAYNSGEGNVDKYGGVPPFAETQGYVSRVAAHLRKNPIQTSQVAQRPPTGVYETALTPVEERQFQTWKARNAPSDSGDDYDLRGAFKAGLKPDPRTGHWPDTFKKPNHPTFSNQSQYAVGADAAKAGRWDGEKFVSPSTTEPDNFSAIAMQKMLERRQAAAKRKAMQVKVAQARATRDAAIKKMVSDQISQGVTALGRDITGPTVARANQPDMRGVGGNPMMPVNRTAIRAQDVAQSQSDQAIAEEKNRTVFPSDSSLAKRLRARGVNLNEPNTQTSVLASAEQNREAIRNRATVVSNQEQDNLRAQNPSGISRLLRALNPMTIADDPAVHLITGQTGPVVLGELSDTFADVLHFVDTGAGTIKGNDYVASAIGKIRDFGAHMQGRGDITPKGSTEEALKAGAGMVGQAEKYGILNATAAGKLPFWFIMGTEAALRTQDEPLDVQAKAVAKNVAVGVALEFGPGLVAKGLGKLPGPVGELAKKMPHTIGMTTASTGLGAAAAYERYKQGGTFAEVLGTGLGTGIGAAALSASALKSEAKEIGRGAVEYMVRSPLTPEPVKDVVTGVLKYGKGLVKSEDGRNLSLYADPETGKVFGNELTLEQAKNYDPSIVTGEKRPVRNAQTVSSEEYDQLARALSIETKTPAKQIEGEASEVRVEKNVTPKVEVKSEAIKPAGNREDLSTRGRENVEVSKPLVVEARAEPKPEKEISVEPARSLPIEAAPETTSIPSEGGTEARHTSEDQARQMVNTLKWNMGKAKELSAADAQTVIDKGIDFNDWASAKSEARRHGYSLEEVSRVAIDHLSGKLPTIPEAGSSSDPYRALAAKRFRDASPAPPKVEGGVPVPSKVLAHVAGPSGAGKTELVNKLGESVKNIKLVDLDIFDDQAVKALGWEGKSKNDYTDEMLDRVHAKRQELIDAYIEKSDKPIVFFGHHVEGDNVTDTPKTVETKETADEQVQPDTAGRAVSDRQREQVLPRGEVVASAAEPSPAEERAPEARPTGATESTATVAKPLKRRGIQGKEQQEAPPSTKERSLPKTLAAAELEKGENLTYEESTLKGGEESGRKIVKEKGVDGAIEHVLHAEPGIDWASTGFAALAEMRDAEKKARESSDLEAEASISTKRRQFAGDFAERATELGRAIVGIRAVAEFAPDRLVYVANRLSRRHRKQALSPKEDARIVKLGEDLERASVQLRSVDAVLAQKQKPKSKPTKKARDYQTRLNEQAETILLTLKPKIGKFDFGNLKVESRFPSQEGKVGDISSLPGDAEEMARYAASRLGVFNTTTELNEHMLAEFGQEIGGYLSAIRQRAYQIRKDARIAELESSKTTRTRRRTILDEIQKEVADTRNEARVWDRYVATGKATAEREAEIRSSQIERAWEEIEASKSKESEKATKRAQLEQQRTNAREALELARKQARAEKAVRSSEERRFSHEQRTEARRLAKEISQRESKEVAEFKREARARAGAASREIAEARKAEHRGYGKDIKARREAARLAGFWDAPLRAEAADARARLRTATDAKNPEVLTDLVSVAIERFLPDERSATPRTKAVDPSRVYVELKDEFPALVTRKNQAQIYRQAWEKIEEVKAVAREAARLRSAKKESDELWEQGIDIDEQAILIRRAEQVKRVMELRGKMANEFTKVSQGRVARAIYGANGFFRAMMSSIDAPLGRQGMYFMLTHPAKTLRNAVPAMMRGYGALRQSDMNALESDIQDHPRYEIAKDLGLDLTKVGGGGEDPLLHAEEQFGSPLAMRFPHVRLSEQGYTAGMNVIRLDFFDVFATALEKDGYTVRDDREAFEEAVGLVNKGTGRGDLPEFAKQATKVSNLLFFAARYGVSSFQMLNDLFNPVKYIPTRFNPAHNKIPGFTSHHPTLRKQQLYHLIRLGFMFAALYGLAKWLGFDVSEFPIIRRGNSRYDLSGGKVSSVKAIMRLAQGVEAWAKGEPSRDLFMDAAHFGRGKLGPVPSGVVDAYYKKTVTGQAANFTVQAPVKMMQENIVLNRLQPMVFGDFADAWADSGWLGLLKASPGLAGMNVGTYPDSAFQLVQKVKASHPVVISEMEKLKGEGFTGDVKPPKQADKEPDEEYRKRSQAETEAALSEVQKILQRPYYQKLAIEDKQSEIRIAIQKGRENAQEELGFKPPKKGPTPKEPSIPTDIKNKVDKEFKRLDLDVGSVQTSMTEGQRKQSVHSIMEREHVDHKTAVRLLEKESQLSQPELDQFAQSYASNLYRLANQLITNDQFYFRLKDFEKEERLERVKTIAHTIARREVKIALKEK